MDIAELLRQRQMLDQLNQITAQGPQAAMLNPGIAQFNTPAGPDPTQIMDPTQPGPSRAPQPSQPQGIMGKIAGTIGNIPGISQIGGLFSHHPADNVGGPDVGGKQLIRRADDPVPVAPPVDNSASSPIAPTFDPFNPFPGLYSPSKLNGNGQ